MLTTYVAAGFVLSAGIGVVLVILLGVSTGPQAPDELRAVIPFILGAVSLSYATGLLSGWVQAPVPDRTGTTPGLDSSTTEWVWCRQREIMITAFGTLGAYLIVRGVIELRS